MASWGDRILFNVLFAYFLFSVPAFYIWPSREIGGALLFLGALLGLWFLHNGDRKSALLSLGVLVSVTITLFNQLSYGDSVTLTLLTLGTISGSILFYEWIRDRLTPTSE